MQTFMDRLGRFLERRRWLVVGTWVALLLVSLPFAARQTEHLTSGGFAVPDSGSETVDLNLARFERAEREAKKTDAGLWHKCDTAALRKMRAAARRRAEIAEQRRHLATARRAAGRARRAARAQARSTRAAKRRAQMKAERGSSAGKERGGGGSSSRGSGRFACGPGDRDGDGDGRCNE